jgi:hypothetical protein
MANITKYSQHNKIIAYQKSEVLHKFSDSQNLICSLLVVIGAIGGASPKPGNGEGCDRKGIRHKILASALLF